MDSERHQTSNPDVSQDIEATKQGNASTMSPGSSLAEFGNSVSVLAQESAQTVQTTVAEGVPQAVNTVQEKISAIVGGAKEATESVSGSLREESHVDSERIGNMSDEQVCDFLRRKNMSNTRSN